MPPISQNIRSYWKAGITSEIQFWDAWLRTKGLQWQKEYVDRCNPDFPLQPRLAALLSSSPTEAHILDVGAGPLTYLGKKCEGKHITIKVVDPLADEYDILLSKYRVQPLVRTSKLAAEDLLTRFSPNTFDLVFARNCLDHAYNPERAIVQMIIVTKDDGHIVLEHRLNEGENENYSGLHQWDFSVSADGDFLICSPYTTPVNITEKYKRLCTITCEIMNNGENDNWLVTRIQKCKGIRHGKTFVDAPRAYRQYHHIHSFTEVQPLNRTMEASPGEARSPARAMLRQAEACPASTKPMVSVIIPCFNQAQFLPDAVESVVQQTFTAWECIIVNDGSPDDTSTVANSLIRKYPSRNIRLVEKENGGLADARNAGVASSTCKYILPLDADDRLAPTMLEKTVALLESQTQIGVAFTYIQHFGDQSDIWRTGPFVLEMEMRDNRIPYCSLYRRDLFDAVGGYNTNRELSPYADWDFWLSALERGWTGELIPEPLFLYRKRANSMLVEANTRREQLCALIRANHPGLFVEQSDRATRVLIVCTHFPPSVGGLETIAAQLGKSLIAKGYDVHVATERSEKREFEDYCGITIHSLDPVPVPGQKVSQAVLQLRELIVSGRYDACILLADPRNWIFWSLEGLEVPEHTRIIAQPLINTEGFARWRDNRDFRTRLTQILKRVHSVVTISTCGVEVQYLREEGISFSYIPNAVERDGDNGGFRARYGIPKSVPVFLHIANLWPVKNHLGLMDVLSTMNGDWRLVIIGHSSGNSQYDTQVRETVQRDPRFMLIPGLPPSEIAAALSAADIFLLASHGEVAPVTVLEAMSHARPWLATPQCGGVHDNAGGLIVPIEDFPSTLSWLVKNPHMLRRLGRLGYEHWRECFRWDVVIHAWDSLIQTGASSVTFAMPAHISEEMQSIRDEILQGIHRGLATAALALASRSPIVSVIVPTYNRPETLIIALRSILDQTYKDFEIIVVNDAGSDVENIVRFLDKDGKITYIRHGSNRNLAAARNTGIRVARGKYIAYLDDDDLYRPDHLQTLITFLEQSECKVAYTDAYRAHQENQGGRYVVTKRDIPYSVDFDYDRILVQNFVPVLCFMHERACLDTVGLFDESLTTHEDWEMWVRLSRRFQFAHIKKVTCEFTSRTDGSTMSSSKRSDFLRTYAIILERYRASMTEKPDVRAAQERVLQRLQGTVEANAAAQPVQSPQIHSLLQQADAHCKAGDFQEATKILEQALELNPGDSQLILTFGNIILRLGDVDGARREFLKAATLHPDYAPAHIDLAAVLSHLGRTVEAEVSARRALELDSTNISALKILARICLDTERYQEAVEAYATILKLAPDDIEILILVGNCYAEVGRHEEAKAFYHRVLQLDPGHAIATENLAVVNGQQSSPTRTSPVVREVIGSEPRYVSIDTPDGQTPRTRFEALPDASSIRGEKASPESGPADKVTEALRCAEAYLRNENLEAAGQVLTEALTQTPDNPDLIVALGHVAWKQDDLERARLQFVRAATLKPNHVQAHTALAILCLQKSRFAEAEEAARTALAIDAAEVTALKVMAKICLDTERYQEAVQAYATILQHDPNDIETLILVGNCYAESGRLEQARSFYQKVLALDPGHTVAAENLVEVDRLVAASDGTSSEPMAPVVSEDRPSVSIVVVTYNSASSILACLDSVLVESRPVTQLIVIDNASTDDTLAILESYRDRATVILNPKNRGFSAACNQGVRASTSHYVALLNPDTVVTPGWLDRLISHIGPGVGAVGPVSNYVAGLQKYQLYDPGPSTDRTVAAIAERMARGNCGRAVETRLLIGFCLLIPRKVLDEVGSLDESLFLGNDDLDLSWRLRLKGYKLLVATDSFIHHEGQVSFKSESETKTSRLVQESTDRLYAKLEAHYGAGNVPSPMELWGIDWFRPTKQAEGRRPKAEVSRTPHSSLLTSIIILTHNGLEHTKKCLTSIEALTPEPHEVIIIDNGSTDGTLDYLRDYAESRENVRVIVNWGNRGFAAGNNQGLAQAQGNYLLLLNNDTVVTSGWLGRMLAVFDRHPEVGIVGPVSNYVIDGPQLLKNPTYASILEMQAFASRWAADHAGQSRPIKRVVGFCLLMRKAVVDRIGGLDERFGSGNFEDDDLCLRAAQVGFAARVAEDVFIHHTGSQTFKTMGIDYRESMERNWKLFKTKWGIPKKLRVEQGYRVPLRLVHEADLTVPLPDLGACYDTEMSARWWTERQDSGAPAVASHGAVENGQTRHYTVQGDEDCCSALVLTGEGT